MDSSMSYYTSDNNNNFRNKHIIITGATGGIGSVLVRTLYDLGAKLLLISHNEKKLKDKFNSILSSPKTQYHHTPLYEILDLSLPKNITHQFPSIMKKLKGRLDILLICHGKYNISLIKDCDIPVFDNMININVRSVFHLMSMATPFLKMTKGNVVVISSLEAKIPTKFGFLNSVTKAMINSLVENSALELASFGVRVNAVAPGVTNTEHRIEGNFNEQNNNDFMKHCEEYFLLNKKPLIPENIVDTILFLASDDASFMTGEIICNDNGYSLNHDLSYNEGI